MCVTVTVLVIIVHKIIIIPLFFFNGDLGRITSVATPQCDTFVTVTRHANIWSEKLNQQ